LRPAEVFRVFRPNGSFVLNIKEGVKDGERQTYVDDQSGKLIPSHLFFRKLYAD
jgi:hypothetical protein